MISAKPMIAFSGVLISWTSSRSESGSVKISLATLGCADGGGRSRIATPRYPAKRPSAGSNAGTPLIFHSPDDQPVAGQAEQGIAERRAQREGAGDVLVDAVARLAPGEGDRAPDQGAARRSVDPGDVSRWPAFPAEQRRGSRRGNAAMPARPRLAAAAAAFDPRDDIAQRSAGAGGAARALRPGGSARPAVPARPLDQRLGQPSTGRRPASSG